MAEQCARWFCWARTRAHATCAPTCARGGRVRTRANVRQCVNVRMCVRMRACARTRLYVRAQRACFTRSSQMCACSCARFLSHWRVRVRARAYMCMLARALVRARARVRALAHACACACAWRTSARQRGRVDRCAWACTCACAVVCPRSGRRACVFDVRALASQCEMTELGSTPQRRSDQSRPARHVWPAQLVCVGRQAGGWAGDGGTIGWAGGCVEGGRAVG